MAKLTSPRRTSLQATLKKVRDAERKAFRKSKDDIVQVVKSLTEEELLGLNLIATGDLLRSIDDDLIELDAFGFRLAIGSLDPAAIYVEDGRPDGQVPVSEIYRWTVARGIEEEAVFPIWRKVKETGFEGKHPFQNVEEKAGPIMHEIIAKNLETIIGKEADG